MPSRMYCSIRYSCGNTGKKCAVSCIVNSYSSVFEDLPRFRCSRSLSCNNMMGGIFRISQMPRVFKREPQSLRRWRNFFCCFCYGS